MRDGARVVAAGAIPAGRRVHGAKQQEAEMLIRHEAAKARLVVVAKPPQAGRSLGHVLRPDPEHDLGIVAALEQGLEMRGARRLQSRFGRRRPERRVERGGNPADALLVDGGEEPRLGREMAIDRGGRHPGGACNVANRGTVISAFGEERGRGIEHQRSSAVLARNAGKGRRSHERTIVHPVPGVNHALGEVKRSIVLDEGGFDRVMRTSRVFAFAAALGAVTAPALAGELRVDIDGLRAPKGAVLIGLYDSAQSFDRAIELAGQSGYRNDPQRVAGAALRVDGGTKASIAFGSLAPGQYAVIVFHDEDGDGRLNKNVLGMPTEPYGFSNAARGFLSAPSFKDAAVAFDGTDLTVAISLSQPQEGVGSSSGTESGTKSLNRDAGGGR